jgi:phosphoribosylformylglycinamidine (FGAM) synthase-like enzyme
VLLFSESPSRFLLEVRPGEVAAVEAIFAKHDGWRKSEKESAAQAAGNPAGVPIARIGVVTAEPRLVVRGHGGKAVIDAPLDALHAAWHNGPFSTEGPHS